MEDPEDKESPEVLELEPAVTAAGVVARVVFEELVFFKNCEVNFLFSSMLDLAFARGCVLLNDTPGGFGAGPMFWKSASEISRAAAEKDISFCFAVVFFSFFFFFGFFKNFFSGSLMWLFVGTFIFHSKFAT